MPILTALLLPWSALAQIPRVPARAPEPKTWMSFSVGAMDQSIVQDGATNSQWGFGNGVQYRVSLEMPVQNQSTIGVVGAFARLPLEYRPLDSALPSGCATPCDADATVTQLMATFHAGRSAPGFHQVLDLSLGAVGYSAFRARDSGARLAPKQLDPDVAAGIGWGFGYTFSPDMQVTLVQEGIFMVHQRNGLPGNADTIGHQFVLRLGTRFGF